MEIRHIITKYDILNVIFITWILLLGATAFLMVPNNYDSMTYHLARVANWVQNESVSYYPTNIERQLYSPIWAEYIILHTYLLLGSDTVANMVQFLAYVLSSILIYMIATKLNFHRIIKYMMVILFITIPMAIAQSVTTQTDMVATLWLLALVNIALDLVQLKSLTFNKDCFVLIFEGATVCAIANLILFILFRASDLSLFYAVWASFLLAAALNYWLCAILLFKHKAFWSGPMELAMYMVTLIIMGGSDYLLTLGLILVGCGDVIAKLISTIICFIGNFVLRKYLVFPLPNHK